MGLKRHRARRVRSAAAGLLAIGLACGQPVTDPPQHARAQATFERIVVSDGWLAMGTFFEADLRVRPEDRGRAREWLDGARREVERLESVYSRWRPASDVSRLNRAMQTESMETTFSVSPELARLVGTALALARKTRGAFDVTAGPLLQLWRSLGPDDPAPSAEVIRRASERVGSRHLLLVEPTRLVVKRSGLELDLDGVSKGAVLDRLAESLETTLPDTPALLSFGESSVRAIGDPDGRGWRLALRSRAPGEPEPARLLLRDRALSISSSLGSTYVVDGEPRSHVIDPRTGGPVIGEIESVVVGESATLVDGWSTALLVLAADEDALPAVLSTLEAEGMAAWVDGPSGRRSTRDWSRIEVKTD